MPRGVRGDLHLTQRVCANCGDLYPPKQAKQSYCSTRCRMEAFRHAQALQLAHEWLNQGAGKRKESA